MLSQKSILTVTKNQKSFNLLCDPDSNLYDVKSSLLEMVGYVQSIIEQVGRTEKESEKKEESVPDTEQTL